MAKINSGSSGFVSGSPRLVHSGGGSLLALVASNPTASAQAITCYDGLSAAAPVLLRLTLPASSAPQHLVFSGIQPLRFSNGLYVDPAGCDLHLTTAAEY
jgi:hypothetical protein